MKIMWTTAMLTVGATLLHAQGEPPRPATPPKPARVVTPRPAPVALSELGLVLEAPLAAVAPEPLFLAEPGLAPDLLMAPMPLASVLDLAVEAPLAPVVPFASLALPELAPLMADIEWQGTTLPRAARVDTIISRDELRRMAEIAREDALRDRDFQMDIARAQAERVREQVRFQSELDLAAIRQRAEMDLQLDRADMQARVEEARAVAEQAQWAGRADVAGIGSSRFSVRAPAPWAGQDVGDSAYRAARALLNRGEYGQAATAFRTLAERFPNSTYTAEAGYYQAFALYRIGGTPELREAIAALDAQRAKYPNARSKSEAAALATRIRGVLASRGDAQAAAQLQADASNQGATCDKEEQAVQAEAMNALSRSDAANVNELITRVLARKDECAVPLRRTAVFLVGNRRDAQAITILSGVARNDPSVDVRVEAISVIGRLPNEDGVPVLEALSRDGDERVQRAAVRALVRHPSARARQSVRALVERDDVSDKVRSDALSAFNSDRATADDITWLKSLYAKFQDPSMKSRTLSAIARVGGPDVDQWLVTIASNENERSELRATAMRRIGSSMSIADLGKLYDGATQQRFRREIISVLGKRKEDAATDKLIDIVKNGTDPSLRTSAISALTNKDDPRATQLLLEIINK